MASGGGPTVMAMLVDIIPSDMRAQGFPILSLFGIPSGLVLFVLGYWLLSLNLTHYTIFWLISLGSDFICGVVLLIFLPETMPDKLRQPLDYTDLNPFKYYWRSIKIICKYKLLIGIVPCIVISSFAGTGMGSVVGNQLWMGPLKFKLKEGLIPGLLGMIVGIPANIIGAIFIPRVGVWPSIFAGNGVSFVLGILGSVWPIWWMNHYHCWEGTACGTGEWDVLAHMWHPVSHPPDHLWIAKWGGIIITTVLGTFAGAFSGPATTAMISMQVKQEEQASVQAAFGLIGGVSAMGAPWIFTHYFFDTTARGWRVIRFAFAGYSLYAISTVLFIATYCVDRKRQRLITNPGLMLKRQAQREAAEVAKARSVQQDGGVQRDGLESIERGTAQERRPLMGPPVDYAKTH